MDSGIRLNTPLAKSEADYGPLDSGTAGASSPRKTNASSQTSGAQPTLLLHTTQREACRAHAVVAPPSLTFAEHPAEEQRYQKHYQPIHAER